MGDRDTLLLFSLSVVLFGAVMFVKQTVTTAVVTSRGNHAFHHANANPRSLMSMQAIAG